MLRRLREHRARRQATRDIITRVVPEQLPERHGDILRAALGGIEGSEWLFPTQKPHKMHTSEVAEHVRNMSDQLRAIRSHLVSIAIEATALRQFSDEFPDDYAKLPEPLREQVDQWVALLRFDPSNESYQHYQQYISRLGDSQSE